MLTIVATTGKTIGCMPRLLWHSFQVTKNGCSVFKHANGVYMYGIWYVYWMYRVCRYTISNMFHAAHNYSQSHMVENQALYQ